MKRTLGILLLLVGAISLSAQVFPTGKNEISGNDMQVQMHSLGDLGWDLIGDPGFEVPRGSNKHPIYASNLWLGAIDDAGQAHVSAQTYRQSGTDYWHGPIANTYDSVYDKRYDRVYRATRAEVQTHIAQWNLPGYQMPADFLDWPAHGDTTNGEPWLMAPFVDVNADQVYTPSAGDYPWFYADEVLYTIYNDLRKPNTETRGMPLSVDIHTTASVYNAPNGDPVDQTMFLNHRIVNRSNQTLNDMHIGQWTDFDLGYWLDDFAGCDSVRNAYFAYNGDEEDEGNNGYGFQPPAIGVKYLNQKLNSFISHRFDFSNYGFPDSARNYFTYLNGGFWQNGIPLTVGGNGTQGTIPTRYHYSGDPLDTTSWAMSNLSSPDRQDIKGLGATGPFTLRAGESICVDMAFIFARTDTGNHIHSVKLLQSRMDAIQAFYDSTDHICDQLILSSANSLSTSPIAEKPFFTIAPNPVQNTLKLSLQEAGTYTVTVYDIQGRIHARTSIQGGNGLNLSTRDWAPGAYFLKLASDKQSLTKKFMKL